MVTWPWTNNKWHHMAAYRQCRRLVQTTVEAFSCINPIDLCSNSTRLQSNDDAHLKGVGQQLVGVRRRRHDHWLLQRDASRPDRSRCYSGTPMPWWLTSHIRQHRKRSKNNTQQKCGPMPNVMAALLNISGALCLTPQSWLTLTSLLLCSNAAKTRRLLKFGGVPQTGKPISAISRPKFTILWGHVEDIFLLNKFFSDCRYVP